MGLVWRERSPFLVVGFGGWVWEFLAVSCSRLNRGIFFVDCCEVVDFIRKFYRGAYREHEMDG